MIALQSDVAGVRFGEEGNAGELALGHPLVEIVAAGTVGMPFHLQHQSRVGQNDAREPRQPFPGRRTQVVFPGVKQNVRHRDHQSPRRILGFQNPIELVQQLGPQLFGRLVGDYAGNRNF